MKKYVSSSLKILLFCLILFGIVLFAAIVMLVLNLVSAWVSVSLMIFAFPLFVLFLTCFLAERSRYLIVDDHQITLPRGAIVNGKTVFEKTVVEFSSIRSFDSRFHKGDHGVFMLIVSLFGGVASKDTIFYSLKLTNGNTVTFTLYEFGKDAEKEIVTIIKHRTALKDDCT